MPAAASIAGTIYVNRLPVTLRKARRDLGHMAREALSFMDTDPCLARELGKEAIGLSRAIKQTEEWRRAAGWVCPEDADERRVDVTGGDD